MTRLKTLLIVDDEPAILKIATLALKRHCHVVTAGSGEEALEILAARPIDALVTDYRMPGITGLELIRASRAVAPELPCLLSTGFATDEALLEASQECVAVGILHKPWTPQELRAAIDGLIAHETTAGL